MHYVYIIKSLRRDFIYVGLTGKLKNRVDEHLQGKVRVTKGYQPLQLLWYCGFTEKSKAAAFEAYLKTGSGRAFAKRHLL